MPQLRSNLPSSAALSIARRAHYTALGIPPEMWERPKVAIVNTSSDLAACFSHLDEIAAALKVELRAAGLLPFEIRTAAPSDFVTSAGRYILPSRLYALSPTCTHSVHTQGFRGRREVPLAPRAAHLCTTRPDTYRPHLGVSHAGRRLAGRAARGKSSLRGVRRKGGQGRGQTRGPAARYSSCARTEASAANRMAGSTFP